jgi:hypothetical protein
MANKLYYESFPDIYRFMDTIDKRPNNDKFGHSSTEKRTDDWAGTKTYEEAVSQFSNGLPEVAEKLQAALTQFTAKANIVTQKRTPRSHYYGYAPNIPAAIIGLPKSMYHIHKIPQKTKTIGILWNSCQNCGVKANVLQQAGESVLQLVYMLERKGYRVQLDCIPFSGNEDGRDFVAVINLKQYAQHMDILKLTFPVTSPAMFRRFGFKWAEGVPNVTGGTVWGYGCHLSKNKLLPILAKQGYNINSTYCIDVNDCRNNEFDPMKIAESLGIIV